MKLENDAPAPDEPEDGWEGGVRLYSNEILTISLCRWSGLRILSLDVPCPDLEQHPPGPCVMQYHSTTALQRGEVDILQYPVDTPVREVRAGAVDDDPIATVFE